MYTQNHTFTSETLTATLLNNEFSALETAWLGIGDALKADGTEGRVLRVSQLKIDDGTTASTLKCTLTNVWNGNSIAETDNIAKNATTGTYWTLNAGGTELKIEASGITGSCVSVIGVVTSNAMGEALCADINADSNDIAITISGTDGVDDDITVLVDTGIMTINLLYITSS